MVITTKNGIHTPEIITALKPNEVFVFGSNRSGIHGAGAAKLAHEKFGAVWGQGEGLYGQSYALPTKDHGIRRTLTWVEIRNHLINFIRCADEHSDLDFWMTKIGCGLAGHSTSTIAWALKEAWGIASWKWDCKDRGNIYYPVELVDEPLYNPTEL